MSHGRERKEKDCLNCGTIVQGRFCQACGQENVEPKETFFSMVMHFFGDITHFDGKFFVTLKDLILKPGFLPAEYIKGRRARYLHPVRMYVFSSAIFFLVFFSISKPEDTIKIEDDGPFSRTTRDSILTEVRKDLAKDAQNLNLQSQVRILEDTSRAVRYADLFPYMSNFMVVGTMGRDYTNRKTYDSVQNSLPAAKRDGWLKGLWNKRAISINEKYKYQRTFSLSTFLENILHTLPYLLFVSLPFFALLLKLLYVRHRNYYYVDHGIFSIHHYVFTFILLLVFFLFIGLANWTKWSVWGILASILFLWGGVYLYISMKKFYKQGYAKTLFKFFLLNISGLVMLVILFIIFSLFAVFQL